MLIEFIYQNTQLYLLNSRIFSTALASLLAFTFGMMLFPPYIRFLRNLHFSSELNGEKSAHEPVMPAGILFLVIIGICTLITVRFNSYVLSALAIYTFFSLIGAADDVAKVVNKRRLAKGVITKQDYQYKSDGISASLRLTLYLTISVAVAIVAYKYIPNINGHIIVPFVSVEKTFPYMPFFLFIPFMALTIAVMANGVNFTDGIDTLSSVPLITCLIFAGVVAYISSNSVWSSYLLIPHIVGVEEILPLVGAAIGTLMAFLWFNSPPSSIIMGDSGSVGLGGLVGILFIFIKAGFYLPIVGFVFLLEFVSVVLQIGTYKITGGKRLFLMAPIHHHFQIRMHRSDSVSSGHHIKSKISWRFHVISVILLLAGLVLFLKVR